MSYQDLKTHKDFQKYITKMENDVFLTKKLHLAFKEEASVWRVNKLSTQKIKEGIIAFGRKYKLNGKTLAARENNCEFGHFMAKSKLRKMLRKAADRKGKGSTKSVQSFLSYDLESQKKELPTAKLHAKNIMWSFQDGVQKCCPIKNAQEAESTYPLLAIPKYNNIYFCFKPTRTKLYKPTVFDGGTNAVECTWQPGGKTVPQDPSLAGLDEFVSNTIIATELTTPIRSL